MTLKGQNITKVEVKLLDRSTHWNSNVFRTRCIKLINPFNCHKTRILSLKCMTAQPKHFLNILCRYPVNVEFDINCFCCCVDWEFTEDAYIYGSTETEGGFIGDDVENNEANASNVAGDENEQTLSEEASYLDVEEEATDTPNSLLGEL